jgi:hypothetical protein
MGDVIIEIIDAAPLSPTLVVAIGQRDDHDVRTGEHMARDPERLGQPQRLDGYVQLQPCHQ